MISWLTSIFTAEGRAKKRHDKIVQDYRYFAGQVGGCIYDIVLGQAMFQWKGEYYGLQDQETFQILAELEEAYALLGYRIIPIENWVGVADGRADVDDLWLVKREFGEDWVCNTLCAEDFSRQPKGLLDRVMASGNAHEATVDEDGNVNIKEIE